MGMLAPDDDDDTTTQPAEPSMSREVHENEEDAVNDIEIKVWGKCIRRELQTHTQSERKPVMNIPRVPDRLRSDSEAPYDPRIISIGPYHHNKSNLKPMEKYKWQYLQAILTRNSDFSLEACIRQIKALERKARKCYSGEFELESRMFVQTMLLDGCFIVEYLLSKNAHERINLGGMIWMDGLLLHDLLLLENQLPLFILENIFGHATKGEITSSFKQVVMNFFNKMFSAKKTGLPSEQEFHHLLHFYYCFFLMPIPVDSNTPPCSPFKCFIAKCMGHGKQEDSTAAATETETKGKEIISMIPNATALEKAGIKFKKRKFDVEGGGILDVKFNRGVMEIPPLRIDASTRTIFRNLIAFEQLDVPDTRAKFNAYIVFLDNIVNTAEDVALLHRNGIIQHMYGSDEEVARLFNELIRGTFTRSNNYLSELYKNVDTHYRAKKHWWWATFVHTYLNSPLRILWMSAGIALLVLTFLQTFFSMFSYFRPHSS